VFPSHARLAANRDECVDASEARANLRDDKAWQGAGRMRGNAVRKKRKTGILRCIWESPRIDR
jgi:hypothetical protein